MKRKINIRGVLIPNSYKAYYDYFGEDSCCPADVQKVLDEAQPGDGIEVYINSPGGVIDVGSEIYTLLRSRQDDVAIYVTGEACSAASIVAMAATCRMSPTALMMVHCVSTSQRGNHSDMERTAETLRTADRALSAAYTAKSGMTEQEVLEMMERETWLTAERALELKLIDGIMFQEEAEDVPMVAGPLFTLPSAEQMEKVSLLVQEKAGSADRAAAMAAFDLLKLRGGQR
ncbi:MAG: Clp protease ClpP [Lachnospiraceae bacterium]|nr:Clp protease ClpP [Lachnospiraceae bacterium]MCM1239963.1 Clp protease ClpP [Lachnospiraceae bacterium]